MRAHSIETRNACAENLLAQPQVFFEAVPVIDRAAGAHVRLFQLAGALPLGPIVLDVTFDW